MRRIVLLILTGAFPYVGWAQGVGSVNVTDFRFSFTPHTLSLEGAYSDFHSDSPFLKKGQWFFKGSYDFVNDPLIAIDPNRNNRLFNIVENVQTLRFGAGYSFSDRLFLGLDLPFQQVHLTQGNRKKNVLGDAELLLKWLLSSNEKKWRWALIPNLILPTGNQEFLTSDDSLGVGLKVALERQWKRLSVYGNLGALYTSNAVFRYNFNNSLSDELDYRKRIVYGIGTHYRFHQKWGVNAEFYGSLTLPVDDDQNPIEANMALFYSPKNHITSFLGTGIEGARRSGARSDDLKMFAGIKWTPRKKETVRANFKEWSFIVFFDTDKFFIRPEHFTQLNRAAQILRTYADHIDPIEIEAHTDSRMSQQYNMTLSLNRARSVRAYLLKQGAPEHLIKVKAYSELRPAAIEKDKITRQQNRRALFHIRLKKGGKK